MHHSVNNSATSLFLTPLDQPPDQCPDCRDRSMSSSQRRFIICNKSTFGINSRKCPVYRGRCPYLRVSWLEERFQNVCIVGNAVYLINVYSNVILIIDTTVKTCCTTIYISHDIFGYIIIQLYTTRYVIIISKCN